MSLYEDLIARAQEFFGAAEDSFEKERYNVTYDDARQATELACKAILQKIDGDYPKDHNVASRMFARGLIPPEIEAKDLSRLLGDYNRGRYRFDDPVSEDEAKGALRLAQVLLEAAESR